MGFRYQNLSFFAEISTNKPLKVCYEVLLSKTFQWQSWGAVNYLWNGINTVAVDDAVHVKFGLKGTDSQ